MASGRRTRRYDTSRRREQARSTREAIVASARRLFALHGYGATTLSRVADDAGVAVQTVYAVFGSKRALLSAMVEAMDEEAGVSALTAGILAAADPLDQLRRVVELTTQVHSRGYDVIEILRGAGTADPDMAGVWREGETRRRRAQARLVRLWAQAGALRRGLASREATDVLWAMTGPDVYRLFVVENRWSLARYRSWLTTHLAAMLLSR